MHHHARKSTKAMLKSHQKSYGETVKIYAKVPVGLTNYGGVQIKNLIIDVTLPLNDGTTKLMSDLRGRHILLDFWASDCAASGEHRESLKELFEATKEKRDEFVIVSIALDNNAETWKAAIKANGTDAEGWIHACECTGMESSLAAKYFKIDKTPRLVLVDPEGRLLSLDMDIDEVQMRVEQILSGDLYYLDQEK